MVSLLLPGLSLINDDLAKNLGSPINDLQFLPGIVDDQDARTVLQATSPFRSKGCFLGSVLDQVSNSIAIVEHDIGLGFRSMRVIGEIHGLRTNT